MLERRQVDSIKAGIVIIPAIHLLICLIYLFFYHYSFGEQLANFAEPTDIFSVSLDDIGPTYLYIFIGFASGVWMAPRRSGNEAEEAFDARKDRERKIFLWVISIPSVFLFLIGILYSISEGFVIWYFFQIPFIIFTIASLGYYFSKRSIDFNYYFLFSLATILMLSSAFRGLDDGQNDKRVPYSKAIDEYVQCGEYAIIRRVGEYYLAVEESEARILLNSDCENKFLLENGKNIILKREISPADSIRDLFT